MGGAHCYCLAPIDFTLLMREGGGIEGLGSRMNSGVFFPQRGVLLLLFLLLFVTDVVRQI